VVHVADPDRSDEQQAAGSDVVVADGHVLCAEAGVVGLHVEGRPPHLVERVLLDHHVTSCCHGHAHATIAGEVAAADLDVGGPGAFFVLAEVNEVTVGVGHRDAVQVEAHDAPDVEAVLGLLGQDERSVAHASVGVGALHRQVGEDDVLAVGDPDVAPRPVARRGREDGRSLAVEGEVPAVRNVKRLLHPIAGAGPQDDH